MQAPSQNIQTEAKQLGVRIEKEGNEYVAILPAHPDLKDDEELGFPAPSEQEALDEIRAYRAIEQSEVYKFEYDEKRDRYIVSFADQKHEGQLLAPTYRKAQEAYAQFINQPETPQAELQAPEQPKQARKRRGNGSKRQGEAEPIPPDPQFSSGRQAAQQLVDRIPSKPDVELGTVQPHATAAALDKLPLMLADIFEEVAKRLRTKGDPINEPSR